VLPCVNSATSPTPPFSNPPHFRIWHRRDFGNWQPPACFGWPPGDFSIVTAISGEFAFDGTGEDLLARIGAVSAFTGIKYWSAGDERWKTFITDSTALSGPDPKARRPDFTLDELKSGRDLYFLRADDRTSRPVLYRLWVSEAGPDRVVVHIGNASPVMVFIITAFDTGDIRSTYILEKIAPGRWGYYAMTLLLEGALVLGNQDESYMVRNVAIFRHLTGAPTDQTPPPVMEPQ
jgi:hypothetical protein